MCWGKKSKPKRTYARCEPKARWGYARLSLLPGSLSMTGIGGIRTQRAFGHDYTQLGFLGLFQTYTVCDNPASAHRRAIIACDNGLIDSTNYTLSGLTRDPHANCMVVLAYGPSSVAACSNSAMRSIMC